MAFNKLRCDGGHHDYCDFWDQPARNSNQQKPVCDAGWERGPPDINELVNALVNRNSFDSPSIRMPYVNGISSYTRTFTTKDAKLPLWQSRLHRVIAYETTLRPL